MCALRGASFTCMDSYAEGGAPEAGAHGGATLPHRGRIRPFPLVDFAYRLSPKYGLNLPAKFSKCCPFHHRRQEVIILAVKTVSSKARIIGRKKGGNAVEMSAYISRTTIKCERNGQTYYPKYSEDLVYSAVMLPEGAPERLKDRAVLWNSVENVEKRKDAQVARTFRISLPNEWSYELATEVMQDYVRRNFTSQGMCCDFAIHDSENKKTHQRNLHCHIMLTMRPLTREGEWGDKQHFIYKLDKDGNRIKKKNGKGYEGHSEPTTDWNAREKATEWRKDLAETINAVNERTGNTENQWEHRSFKERGLDIIPEIHLGARACALENKGVHTERGNVNRRIRMLNSAVNYAKDNYLSAKKAYGEFLSMPAKVVQTAKTEITEMLERVQSRMGRLALPIVSAKYLAKIPNREKVQNIGNAKSFLERNRIETFEQLKRYQIEKGNAFDKKEQVIIPKWKRLEQLRELAKAYAEYEPYKAVHDMSSSLSGIKKLKYDKEHEHELAMYENTRADLKLLLAEGEKITPKAWKTEQGKLEKEMPELRQERARACHDLAIAEVINYNKANLERLEQNESRQRNRQQGMTKRKEEKEL